MDCQLLACGTWGRSPKRCAKADHPCPGAGGGEARTAVGKLRLSSTHQGAWKIPEIPSNRGHKALRQPSNRDHNALNGGTLGGLGRVK